MELTFLGTGTATPDLKRNASGMAIRCEDLWLLVDIGPGTLRRMCEAGIDYKWIDGILVTHFHADHTADLAAFLFASNYAYGPFREEPFTVVGPRGLNNFYEALKAAYGHWIVPRDNRLSIHELDTADRDNILLHGVDVVSVPSRHSAPSLSYRLSDGNTALTVSGDTDYSEYLIELACGSDCLICECSMPDGMKVDGHLIPSEAGMVAAAANVEKLVLTHFYPPCEDVDVKAQASALFKGEIIVAQDLMVMEV